MRIVNGENAIMGRLASFVAKGAMKGEEFAVVNCERVIITGDKKEIKEKYLEKREKVGSGQQGPKHSRLSERIIKRAIRGMLSNHRRGMGKLAYRRIKCYSGIPKEFEGSEMISMNSKNKGKHITVKYISLK